MNVTVTLSREQDDGSEQEWEVKCSVTPGHRGTRLDPPEDPEVCIDSIKPLNGAPPLSEDDLDPSEVEKLDLAAVEAAAQGYLDAVEREADCRRDR
jgi:hypothetical protein